MDLLEIHNRLEFFINKAQGEYLTPAQEDKVLDIGQMALFNDYYIKFAESQRINDALAPFKRQFTFTNATSPGGLITAPADYFDQISLYTIVQDQYGKTRQRPCPRLNENELAGRLNSQLYPPTLFDPVCMTVQDWDIQLYPQVPQAGILFYLSRPAIPVFVYTGTGRTINYNALTSTQLEWADKDISSILVKALNYIGISTREQDVAGWASTQDQQNIMSQNKI